MTVAPGAVGELGARRAAAGLTPQLAGPLTALAAAAAVVPLAAADGGYFSTSWGWAALPFAWVATLALVLRERIRLGSLELAFVGALAALTAWIGLSLLWTQDFPQTVLELERVLVYPAGAVAAVLVLRRARVAWLAAGLAVGVTAICAYALATRLFPTALQSDAIAQNRLQTPIGYWNGLAVFATMGTLLLVGLAGRAGWRPGRALAAAATLVTVPTLYFTYGRAGWLALACGLLVALAVDPRRAQLFVTALAVAPFPAIAVYLCASSHALTALDGSLSRATRDGHRVAVAIALLAAAAAAATLAREAVARRVTVAPAARRACGSVLVLVLVAAIGAVLAHFGGPAAAARKAYRSFTASPVRVQPGQSLNRRLLSFSNNGRVQLWKVASHDFREHPALGSGAGSFGQYWYRHRATANLTVRDAHSLYVETAAELGVPGLVLLAAALLAPLVALARVRSHRLAPALAAAYVAYLVAATFDWDWELPAVTLVAVLAAAGLVVLARDERSRQLGLAARVAVAVALLVPLAGFSLYTLIGNRQMAVAAAAVDQGRWRAAAAAARDAAGWQPWSPTPWHALAAAEAALGHRAAAVAAMRRAVRADPGDWTLWYDLGNVATGSLRAEAYARARELNPRQRGVP